MASSPLAEGLLARGISPTETSPSEVLQQILYVLQHHWPSSDRLVVYNMFCGQPNY